MHRQKNRPVHSSETVGRPGVANSLSNEMARDQPADSQMCSTEKRRHTRLISSNYVCYFLGPAVCGRLRV